MLKTAIITGITGQTGSYLAELLIEKQYMVHGIIRRNSVPQNQTFRIEHLRNHPQLELHYADVTDTAAIYNIIHQVQPHEVYHMAAQSHVGQSFEMPLYTAHCNAIGTLNILEAVRMTCKTARVYHAATSELFGNNVDMDGFQRETTRMEPVSPYGCSKLYAHTLCQNYRKAYEMFIVSGICYNHESKRRGANFVTSKVVKTAVEIKKGLATELLLGSMSPQRDWGHAKDYAYGIYLMLQQPQARNYVLATGETRSVQDLVDYVFDKLGLDKSCVKQSQKFIRPEELWMLKGDASRAKQELGWKPTISFHEMIDEMIEYWENNV